MPRFPAPPGNSVFCCKQSASSISTLGSPLRDPWVTLGSPLGHPGVSQSQSQTKQSCVAQKTPPQPSSFLPQAKGRSPERSRRGAVQPETTSSSLRPKAETLSKAEGEGPRLAKPTYPALPNHRAPDPKRSWSAGRGPQSAPILRALGWRRPRLRNEIFAPSRTITPIPLQPICHRLMGRSPETRTPGAKAGCGLEDSIRILHESALQMQAISREF
jgi:hypothetical protein